MQATAIVKQPPIKQRICGNCHRIHNGYHDVCSMLCNEQIQRLNRIRRNVTTYYPDGPFLRFMLQVALDDKCAIEAHHPDHPLGGRFPACPVRRYVLRTRLREVPPPDGHRSRSVLLNHAYNQHKMGVMRKRPGDRRPIASVPDVVLL